MIADELFENGIAIFHFVLKGQGKKLS